VGLLHYDIREQYVNHITEM